MYYFHIISKTMQLKIFCQAVFSKNISNNCQYFQYFIFIIDSTF